MKNILIPFLFLLVFFTSSKAQWKKCEGPLGGKVDFFGFSGTTFFGLDYTGQRFNRSTDQGVTWSDASTGLDNPYVFSIETIGSSIFARTILGGLNTSSDGGSTWKTIDAGLNKASVSCLAVKDNTLFVGTNKGVFSTSNNGEQWNRLTNGLTNLAIRSIFVKGTNLFAATIENIFFSSDNGNNWASVSKGLPSITGSSSIQFAAIGDTLYAGIEEHGVFASVNNGATWTDISLGLPDREVKSITTIGTNLFAATYHNISLTTDNGATWTKTTWAKISNSKEIFDPTRLIRKDTVIYVQTKEGKLYCTIDKGTTWQREHVGLSNIPTFTFFTSGENIFAGTDNGIYLSTNKGESWIASNSGMEDSYVTSIIASGTNLFTSTLSDGVFLSVDNGRNWKTVNNGLKADNDALNKIKITTLITIGPTIMAGTDNGIFISSDSGSHWIEADTNLKGIYITSLVMKENRIYAGTHSVGVLVSSDGGTHWTYSGGDLLSGLVSALIVRGTDLYAGTIDRGIFRSTNNGADWLLDADGIVLDSGGFSVRDVRCFAENNGSIFCGTGSGVFISKKAGTQWKAIDSINPMDLTVNGLIFDGSTLLAGTWEMINAEARGGVWKYDTSILNVEDNDADNHVTASFLYPNPATNTLTIDRARLQFPENTPVHYTFSTLVSGKVMEFDNSEQKFTVSLDGLASGVYLLTAESGGKSAAVMVTVME